MEPLVEEDDGMWVLDEQYDAPVPVLLSSLERVVEADYGQRQDTGHGNPHGEHAHDVWQVSEPLPPSVLRGPAHPSIYLPPSLAAANSARQ